MAISAQAPKISKPAAVLAAEAQRVSVDLLNERIDRAVIMDGEPVMVRLRDGSEREMRVRVVSVAELPAFLSVQENEPAVIELVMRQEKGWADTLHPRSHFELVEVIRALNFPLALQWSLSQLDMVNQLAAGLPGRADARRSPRSAPGSETS